MSVPADLVWEVVVVDNNSRDETQEVVSSFAQRAPITVRYVCESRQGLNYARNTGVQAAQGELLSFIDDDVIVTANWLGAVKKAFAAYPVVCVGGKVLLKHDLSKPTWWNEEYDGPLGKFDNGNAVILSDEHYSSIIGIGANLSFKRAVFAQYGLFRPDLDRRKRKLLMGGDIEFAQRLKKAGESIMYYPDAVVYHCPDGARITKAYLRRWYFRIGEWEARKSVFTTQEPAARVRVPRWRYRKAMEYLVKACFLTVQRRHAEALYNELQGIACLGYMLGAAKRFLQGRRLRRER